MGHDDEVVSFVSDSSGRDTPLTCSLDN